jgi:hypothetical protein
MLGDVVHSTYLSDVGDAVYKRSVSRQMVFTGIIWRFGWPALSDSYSHDFEITK